MRKTAWIALFAFVAAAGLSCGDKDEPEGPKGPPGKRGAVRKPPAPKPKTPTQPSTRPKEFLEASKIFEKLTQPPTTAPATQKAAPAPAPDRPAPRGPTGPKGETEPVEDEPVKPVPPPPPPADRKPPQPPEDTPTTKKAEPAPPVKKPAEPPRFLPARRRAPNGYVDWARGRIVATGQGKSTYKGARGKLMAVRAATVVAKRNALLIAAGIEMSADGRVRRPAAGTIEARGQIRFARTLKEEFDEQTRAATVTIEVPMYGLKGAVRADGRKIKVRGTRWRWIVRDPVKAESDLILIDARGTDFQPVLSPRLVNEAGQIVFDPADEKALLGERHAFVHVEYSAHGPLVHHGAFRNVILLRPARATDGTLVLTAEDLKTLMRHRDARELLRAGRAVIITKHKRPPDTP